jgi:hypothetical protein
VITVLMSLGTYTSVLFINSGIVGVLQTKLKIISLEFFANSGCDFPA